MLDDSYTNDYYNEATKNAAINNRNIKNKTKTSLLILSLSLIGVVSFFGYNSSQDNKIQHTKVMGVSHIKSAPQNDIDYAAEIEKLDTPDMEGEYNSQLINYVNKEVNKPPKNKWKDLVDYVNKEGNKASKNKWRDIVVVVKQGDTLTTLAKKYYNDSNAYIKIINNNSELTKKSHVIYPGQKLKISQPY
ncbi:MAG: LysM peptidoglycan-binding domain-containing protein [Sulfurovaceae bacterium]|nr:LysM peptidoglycan-binding domain-containing protein [Sulfurovaceae bacterium]